MSEIYTFIVGILGILAISGLFVGVTNDAVNFLNSAIGSKAASMKVILLVASLGIIVGVVTSSGMMEVARSGMFNPGLFTFHEVMMLYLGVMFANVILLDLYNSWGLPTSTTVSLIFCLLGSAIAVSIYKISNDPEQGIASLGHYINTSRAMGIVSAILLSVVIAFTCGTVVMYISRLIFSFRYTVVFRRYGSLWCGASLTSIIYFAVFKGLKSILAGHDFIRWIDHNLLLAIFICWMVCSLALFFIQRFKINILRITILSGTFALALAFAGNDLVNFIGVPVAGFDAFSIARHSGDAGMLMEALNENVPANFLILLAAGAIGPRPVRIEGLRADSLQGDRVMLDILRDMGARIDIEPDAVTVHPSELRGVVADMSRCPDLVPTVAVVAAHASGPTRLWNAAHLRIKECDRIAVPAQELSKVGVRCDEHDDGLTIHGDPALASRLHSLDGIAFSAHGDHRIAMSLALLELRGGRLTLDDPSCVSKSFPNFWESWGQVRV